MITIGYTPKNRHQAMRAAINAYRTYKAFCKALGRFSKLKNSRGKAIAMRALNVWRSEFYRLSIIERQLRAI